MGFLDIFIERTPDDKPKEVKSPVTLPIGSTTPPTVTSLSTPTVSQPELEKFNAHFDEIFDKANLPGPDYYEFNKMAQAMGNMTDEIKYPAVFSALKVQGLSKQKLIETASQYIGVIENDEKQFSSLLDSKVLGEINRKKAALETNTESIKKKEELISKLTEEIAQEKTNLSTLTAEIQSDEKKYNDKSVVYKAAAESKKSVIKADIDKINRLLL